MEAPLIIAIIIVKSASMWGDTKGCEEVVTKVVWMLEAFSASLSRTERHIQDDEFVNRKTFGWTMIDLSTESYISQTELNHSFIKFLHDEKYPHAQMQENSATTLGTSSLYFRSP